MVNFVKIDGVYVESSGMTATLDNEKNVTVTREGSSVRLSQEEVQALITLCSTQSTTWVGTCLGCQKEFSHEGPGDWSHCTACEAAALPPP
jgi:predicted aldo/keto reductase-like oxidoreductase